MAKVVEAENRVFNPFGNTDLVDKNHRKLLLKNIFKHSFRICKLLLYLFLTLMGLWGCFQFTIEPGTATSSKIGVNLEFGFPYGTTGDGRYDLQSSGGQPYFIFNDWSFDYGPFYAFFVGPFSRMVLALMWSMSSLKYGFNALISIFILLLIIRALTIVFSLNASLMTERMSEVSGQLAEINAKYRDVTDPNLRRMRQLEQMELYKKNKLKPAAIFTQGFVTIPIFLVVLRIVNSMRPIKTTIMFNVWDMSTVPFSAIFQNFLGGGGVYIFFLLLVLPFQFLATKLPQVGAQKRNGKARTVSDKGLEQMKKNRRMTTIISIVFMFIVMISVVGVGIYWFLNSLFSLLQSYIIHRAIMRRRKIRGEQSKLAKILEL